MFTKSWWRTATLLGYSFLSGQHLWAQVPVRPAVDHERLLASADPKLAANKRLVYDFWREVFEAGHLDKAEAYLAESYVQHNPNVGTGRDAFVRYFKPLRQPRAVQPRVLAPLVSITAEGDTVVLAFAREYPDPLEPGHTYTSTWFDQFRIEQGKIVEHWDPAQKPAKPSN